MDPLIQHLPNELTSRLAPEVTRMGPDGLMAAHAAELLIERLESRTAPGSQRYSFVCPVVDRASVAPPSPTRSPAAAGGCRRP